MACVGRAEAVRASGAAGATSSGSGARFAKARPATLYFDEIRTPTYTDCLNGLLESVLGSQLAGIYHAGGPRQLSLYEIGQIINRLGGYSADCLMGRPRGEAGPIPPRAGNVTMDSSKLRNALGYQPFATWPLRDEHVPTHRDWHRERPVDEPGSVDYLMEVLARNPARQPT